MAEPLSEDRDVVRFTCVVPSALGGQVTDLLAHAGAHTILVENGRAVRQRITRTSNGLFSRRMKMENSSVEVFRTSVHGDSAEGLLQYLRKELDLGSPGRGLVYAQRVREISQVPTARLREECFPSDRVPLGTYRLLTVILAEGEGSLRVSESALSLGACVPVVTRGEGTGLRDRMGLLRITIPPDKELLHLLLTAQDAPGIQRLLIEDARLNRTGGGFLYQTDVCMGLVDPLLRIGRFGHAASMEQLIAAMDELKRGPAWRKRFTDDAQVESGTRGRRQRYYEIQLICSEEKTEGFVRGAIEAGARAATTSQVRCLSDRDRGGAARVRVVFCIPADVKDRMIETLLDLRMALDDPLARLQIQEVNDVFTHQR